MTTSQFHIFFGTIVLPALWSSFVRYTSSRSQMFYKIGALKIFCKIHRKSICVGVSFVKETPTQTFSCGFCEIF